MKPAELLTVAVSIPLVIGVLAVSPQPGRDARPEPVASVQASLPTPAMLEEVVVTAKRTNSIR